MGGVKSTARRILFASILSMVLSACLFRVTPPMVKIGLVAPFEGLYRAIGYDALFAVRLALRERNQAGGVAGYRVDLVALDDSAEPQQAQEQARELALDPQVMGVIGHLRDETTLAAAPVYHEQGLPLIALGAPSLVLDGNDQTTVFRLDADQSHTALSLLDYARSDLRVKRLALLGFRDDVMDNLLEAVREFGDMEIRTYPSARALLDGVARDARDAILYAGADQSGAQFIDSLRETGSRSVLLGDQGLDTPIFVAWAGREADGVVYASSNVLVDDPEFIAQYRGLAATDPGPQAALAYDAAGLLLRAIEESIRRQGLPTRRGVLESLRRGEIYVGLTGDVRFDQNGQRVNTPVYLYRIESGRYPGVVARKYSHSYFSYHHSCGHPHTL
ncbi:MAG: branched-chain amino acid ABC transporter substrate-binding protein [Chloroflexi bacterium]|nr:branched-chain amino acid ABC transporter substrate-binding protein [Chloroflexota bacterium]